MSTATLTPNGSAGSSTDSQPAVKNYNDTYRIYAKATAEGKIDLTSIRMVTAGKDNKTWNTLDEKDPTTGLPKLGYVMAFEQSVKQWEAGTFDGISQIVEDKVEATNIWNKGASQKVLQKLKSVLTETNDDGTAFTFTPVDVYDTLELLQAETQRRNLSPADKVDNMIRASVKLLFPSLEGDAFEERVQAVKATFAA